MWKYVGKGRYAMGVPARDLTDNEYKRHAARLLKDSPAAKLYRKVKNTKPKAQADAAAPPAEEVTRASRND